ncbi:dynamin-like protein [Leptotrombidium deliense]|uniref:dynamin GTPase n=1 Tax=Leptotrombidium deliense TaxID=299467 RepID=A0A443SEA3_9ACAR|nr:dynamin-like protein [Leptotrombidium deliense]
METTLERKLQYTMNIGNDGMRKLIEIINRVQDASSRVGGKGLNLDLPQIAVVGGQSAGKSSVLENFVGRDFLPRGSGIVTRCPLILQLIHSSNEEYGSFLHKQTKKYYNFNEIRDEIQRETDRKIGKNKNVSSDPINLRIYSPNVLDLTLIDLPGLTQVPVEDQPKDIAKQIIKVVLDYISRENCLILAVSAANQDIATSDAIKIASQVDSDGERTIGVLTKLDLMDRGTDARNILDNKVVQLKRGYIALVNRSQSDITTNKDIKSAIEAEENFFQTHRAYCDIANRLGTPFLQKYLNEQLTMHIKNALPGLVNKLESTRREVKEQLQKCKMNFGDENSKTKIIFNALKEITNEFEMKIGFVVKTSEVCLPHDKLTGGAQINRIMNKKYRSAIRKILMNDDEIRREIAFKIPNLRGVRIGLFTPDMAFDTVVASQLARFKDPSNFCIDLVCTELLNIVRDCCTNLKFYPKLRELVEKHVTEHIEKRQRKAKDTIKERIAMESAYMNTDHEDFVGLSGAMRLMEENNSQIAYEGWMSILNLKCYWFVLSDCSLSWYQKNDKKDRLAHHEVNQATHMQPDVNGTQIQLNFVNNKKADKIDLVFQTKDEFNKWYQAFLNVGIIVDESQRKSPLKKHDNCNGGAALKSQIEVIRILVDSYLKIIKKNMQDFIPKLVMYGVINNTREFLSTDLHVALLKYDEKELLKVDPETEKLCKELTEKYDFCNQALTMIRNILTESF